MPWQLTDCCAALRCAVVRCAVVRCGAACRTVAALRAVALLLTSGRLQEGGLAAAALLPPPLVVGAGFLAQRQAEAAAERSQRAGGGAVAAAACLHRAMAHAEGALTSVVAVRTAEESAERNRTAAAAAAAAPRKAKSGGREIQGAKAIIMSRQRQGLVPASDYAAMAAVPVTQQSGAVRAHVSQSAYCNNGRELAEALGSLSMDLGALYELFSLKTVPEAVSQVLT